jgi:hypothetical protein
MAGCQESQIGLSNFRGGDLLVLGARAANWVIIPVGCPTCLTLPGQMEELPEALDKDVVVIETGADLRAVIESC